MRYDSNRTNVLICTATTIQCSPYVHATQTFLLHVASKLLGVWVFRIGRGKMQDDSRHSSYSIYLLFIDSPSKVQPHPGHTALILLAARSSARMMALTGSRGDSLGSVASCPGLRVKYWKLRSGAIEIENPRTPRGSGPGNMQSLGVRVQTFLKKKRREKDPTKGKGV
jgi:hypothetical protein